MKKRGRIEKKARGVSWTLKGFEENNLRKTIIFTIIFSILIITLVAYIQLYILQSKIISKCSYLDPITIDFLAFFASLFLVIEGFARIIEHPNASLKRQSTRILRISLGFSILTLHIIQFLHK